MKKQLKKRLNTKENFINVLVDCQGYGEDEAIEMAAEYRNNLENFISNCGEDDLSIEDCLEFCGIIIRG